MCAVAGGRAEAQLVVFAARRRELPRRHTEVPRHLADAVVERQRREIDVQLDAARAADLPRIGVAGEAV